MNLLHYYIIIYVYIVLYCIIKHVYTMLLKVMLKIKVF